MSASVETILKYWIRGYKNGSQGEHYTLNQAKDNLEGLIAEAYKQGHIDGSIEVVNNTCEFCHSYPMTANCNNAGCS